MRAACPECGCALSEETSCQEIFESFLALEFSSPAYGEVHMLTVACFMTQHGRYSDAALAWISENLRAHLQEGLTPAQIRQQIAQNPAQARRDWRITRAPDEARQAHIAWSMSIGDVALNYQDAASYRAQIRQWAATVLADMQPLLANR